MKVSGSHTASRNAPRTNDVSPAARRAPVSQARKSAAKPTMYQAAFHLVPTARPRNTPAASCHLRRPSRGPPGRPGWRATSSASRARETSRSIRMQPNAASTKNIRKMSRIPVLDSTNSSPSSDISSPAMQPSRVDLVIRRAIRQISRIGQRAEHRAGEPPAERVQPEQPLPYRDQQLADLGLDHVLPARRGVVARREEVRVPGDDDGIGDLGLEEVQLHPVLQDAPGVLGVVRLVEDQRLRHPQPVEPQERAERGHEQRPQPPRRAGPRASAPPGARGARQADRPHPGPAQPLPPSPG